MAGLGELDDGELCDNWEDIIENGELDKKLANMKFTSHSGNDDLSLNKSSQTYNITVVQENSARTQYVPPEPTVKILRRPGNSSDTSVATTDRSPSRQITKTLQQREAEYAEARKRIMGCDAEVPSPGIEQSNRIVCSKRIKGSDVKLVREPIGPDGTSGFSQKR